MDFTWSRIDLDKTFQSGEMNPALVLDRKPSETWLVAESGLFIDRATDWTFFRSEAQFRIPLVPYLLNASPDLAFAHMFAIGMKCLLNELKRPVKRLHIVTGTPVEDVQVGDESRLRYWFGFAVLV